MRADWIQPRDVGLLLALLTPPNRLICRVSLACGLRVGDVVALEVSQVANPRAWVTEAKTGKKRRLALGGDLRREILAQAGERWAFESPRNPERHRTRQAVWADLKRAGAALRLPINATPHSMRKCFAVDMMEREGLGAVQRALAHDDEATTLLYALADRLGGSRGRQSRRKSHRES